MLIKARQWINQTFEQKSKPTLREVQSWVENGELKGKTFGGHLYIYDSFALDGPTEVQPHAGVQNLKKNLLN